MSRKNIIRDEKSLMQIIRHSWALSSIQRKSSSQNLKMQRKILLDTTLLNFGLFVYASDVILRIDFPQPPLTNFTHKKKFSICLHFLTCAKIQKFSHFPQHSLTVSQRKWGRRNFSLQKIFSHPPNRVFPFTCVLAFN